MGLYYQPAQGVHRFWRKAEVGQADSNAGHQKHVTEFSPYSSKKKTNKKSQQK